MEHIEGIAGAAAEEEVVVAVEDRLRIVTSGEECSSSGAEEQDDSSDLDEQMRKGNDHHPPNNNNNKNSRSSRDGGLLYGKNMDDEDEAWVYKHMRGGVEETVSIQQRSSSQQQQQQQQLGQAKLLKPRNSDAILSCPCCFNIVCMDCQQHERYVNQFRAMFVMNIGVNWGKHLVYCKQKKGLIAKEEPSLTPSSSPEMIPNTSNRYHNQVLDEDDPKTLRPSEDDTYYSVFCSNCQTEVAALNMEDEVYHFFGCLASA